jgi:hypothetical protein
VLGCTLDLRLYHPKSEMARVDLPGESDSRSTQRRMSLLTLKLQTILVRHLPIVSPQHQVCPGR